MRLFQKGFLLLLLSSVSLFSEENKPYYASTIVPYCPKEGGNNNQGPSRRQDGNQGAGRNRETQDLGSCARNSATKDGYNGDGQKGDSSQNSNPPKNPCGLPEPSASFYASAIYEYLKLAQEGLAFALSSNVNEDFQVTSTNVVNPKSPWKSVLGINLGAVTAHGWTIDLAYTMAYNKNNNTQTVGTPGRPYTNITFLWNSFFNRVDLTLSKSCNLNPCLPFFPFVGLVLGFDNQTFKSNYIQLVDLVLQQDYQVLQQDYWNTKQNWWSLGPYLGGEFVYFFADSFLFLFRGGASINLSSWNAHRDVTNTPDLNSTLVPIPTFESQVSNSYLSLRSMCDFIIGFRYQTDLSPGKPLFFQIDWRGQLWPNHLLLCNYIFTPEGTGPTIIPAASFPTPSNFSMQGVGVAVGVSF